MYPSSSSHPARRFRQRLAASSTAHPSSSPIDTCAQKLPSLSEHSASTKVYGEAPLRPEEPRPSPLQQFAAIRLSMFLAVPSASKRAATGSGHCELLLESPCPFRQLEQPLWGLGNPTRLLGRVCPSGNNMSRPSPGPVVRALTPHS
jgi:hypothetical protein